MKLFAVLKADAVHNQVIMDGMGVCVSSDKDLKARKVFRKLQADFVRGLGSEVVVRRERLHDMVVTPAVLLVKPFLDKAEFIERTLG